MNFDIELLGDGDVIINEICHRLGEGWNHLCSSSTHLKEITELPKQRVQEKNISCAENDKLYTSLDSGDSTHSGDSFEKAGTSTETSISPISESCTEKNRNVEGLSRIEETVGRDNEETSVYTESADECNLPSVVSGMCSSKPVEVDVGPNSVCLPCKRDSKVETSVEESHTRNDHLLPSGSSKRYLTIQNGVADLENNTEKDNSGKLASLLQSPSYSLVQSTEIGSTSSSISGKSRQQKPRRQSVTEYMEASTYLFIPPNRYVFHGAEVFSEESSDEEAAQLCSDHGSFLSPQSEPEYAKCAAAIEETVDAVPSDLPSSSVQADIAMSNQDESNNVEETMDVKLAGLETDLLNCSQKSATSL